jgi:ornithine cyclodeaminase/alanine dehydrogenase-like protein (mu-crystallin family)
VSEPTLLYLSRGDVETLEIPVSEVIGVVEGALRDLGAGASVMPAKTRLAPDSSRYYSAMPAVLPGRGVAAVKWNSIVSANPARGLPFIVGLIILNDDSNGLPIAVLDSTWVTAWRTAAASAVTARHLLGREPVTLGLFGCGVQGRTHAEAMRSAFPSLRRIQAFDPAPATLARYASEVADRLDLEVVPCSEPRPVTVGADLIVTATPTTVHSDVLDHAWLTPGQVVVSIEYDCFWRPGSLNRLDAVFTDDLAQFEKGRSSFGYYTGFTGSPRSLPAVVAGKDPGRETADQIIGAFNAGVAVEDAATAQLIYERARSAGAGTRLPL